MRLERGALGLTLGLGAHLAQVRRGGRRRSEPADRRPSVRVDAVVDMRRVLAFRRRKLTRSARRMISVADGNGSRRATVSIAGIRDERLRRHEAEAEQQQVAGEARHARQPEADHD